MSKVLIIMEYGNDLPIDVVQMLDGLSDDEAYCAWCRDQPGADKDVSDSDLMDCEQMWESQDLTPATSSQVDYLDFPKTQGVRVSLVEQVEIWGRFGRI